MTARRGARASECATFARPRLRSSLRCLSPAAACVWLLQRALLRRACRAAASRRRAARASATSAAPAAASCRRRRCLHAALRCAAAATHGAMQARARDEVVVIDNGGCTIKAGLASAPSGVRCATPHENPHTHKHARSALTISRPASAQRRAPLPRQLRAQLRGEAEGREAAVCGGGVGGVS
jgi:hypothetical protein